MGVKDGVAPCMEEVTVKRKLPESPSQLLGVIFIHLTPVAGRLPGNKWKGCTVRR